MTSQRRHFDVVIIGGGMAGVSLAAAVAGQRSVVVVEAEEQLAHHSTGRSAASYVSTYGPGPVRMLTRASRRDLEATQLDGVDVLSPRPVLWTAFDDDSVAELDALIAEAPGLERLDPEGVRRRQSAIVSDQLLAGAVEEGAGDIDVLALHQMNVRRARSAGADVRTGVRVLGGDARSDGRVVVETSSGPLSADIVVNAAGAWADAVADSFGVAGQGMRPLRRTIAVARPSRDVDPSWPFVIEVSARCYFKPEGPNVLVSPVDETPVEAGDVRAEEIDVARAIDRVNEVTDLGLRSVQSAWAGLRTFAPDGCPVVGFDPADPRFFWFAGQGGYGIQMAPALAEVGAAVLLGTPVPDHVIAEGFALGDIAPRSSA